MSKALIVLGMHRSGTSALTGSLEQAGIYLGDVNEFSPDNVKGNRELQQVMILNDDILKASGGTWDAPVSKVHWSPLHKLTRDLIVDSFSDKEYWAFKDPRTLLVLSGWLGALPTAELVYIFRHPYLVADSLFKRNAIGHEKGIELWVFYNRILKWHLERSENAFLIEFSASKMKFKRQLNSLITHLGFENTHPNFYNPELMHTEIPDLNNLPNAKKSLVLYESLKDMLHEYA